jgi:Fic family protein
MSQNYITALRAILKTGSFSQHALAKRLGVTFAALNRWINGHSVPRKKRQDAILKLYREIIGFPAISKSEILAFVKKANQLRKKNMWGLIAKNQLIHEKLLLEHTYNSTTIEGNTLDLRETEAVLFSGQVIEDKTLIEHLEVTNHAAVLRGILKQEQMGPITERLVKSLHQRLMQGIREDAGFYAKTHRGIRGLDIHLTHPKDIPEDIADFHASFELIHPFGDGNGRVGRLLMVIQCLEVGYYPLVIENKRKVDYYDVLEYAQKKSPGPFVMFVVEELERTAKLCTKLSF